MCEWGGCWGSVRHVLCSLISRVFVLAVHEKILFLCISHFGCYL